MYVLRCTQSTIRATWLGLGVLVPIILGTASCTSPQLPTRPGESSLDPGWPKAYRQWLETGAIPPSERQTSERQTSERRTREPEVGRSPLHTPLPAIPGALFVGQDTFCGDCHETFFKAFTNNAHGKLGCEQCHGGANLHLETRGQQPNSILSFARPERGTIAGGLIGPAERSEICLKCHDQGQADQVAPCVLQWRTSAHAHQGVACSDCHRAHYLVPPGTPSVDSTVRLDPWGGGGSGGPVVTAAYEQANGTGQGPHNLAAISPDVCYPCHSEMASLESVDHPHQIGVPLDFPCTACHDPPPQGPPHFVKGHPQQFDCTTCHDPHGNVRQETKKDLCLKCHGGAHMSQWQSSPHDLAGVNCTDCHNPHPKDGLPMCVDQPTACYQCHGEMQDLERIAHPHQILGPNGFNCTTCHDPHGRVVVATRRDKCLECHTGAPTMAWHSSTHNQQGVACADCHNPHPKANVPQVVGISHTQVSRPGRLPMCVDEPGACYQCHQEIYGMTALPSHHPIAEGKMVCSDCHESHGQAQGQLKEETVNELCYECHAEKEGPFAYEHAPVTENCAICHNPHGTVANNLLHQPTTFLCLRCHSGHSTHGRSQQCDRCHFVDGEITNVGGGPLGPTIPTTPTSREALFTDCTQCHSQVHGSDLPNGTTCFNTLTR